jgi:hypothetical protein
MVPSENHFREILPAEKDSSAAQQQTSSKLYLSILSRVSRVVRGFSRGFKRVVS